MGVTVTGMFAKRRIEKGYSVEIFVTSRCVTGGMELENHKSI